MNIDIINVGHYRATSHGGRLFDLFNRETDKVVSITKDEFNLIKEHRSIEAASYVMSAKEIGINVGGMLLM